MYGYVYVLCCVVGVVSVHNSTLLIMRAMLACRSRAISVVMIWRDCVSVLRCVWVCKISTLVINLISFVTLVVYHRASNYDVAGVCHDCVHPSHPFILSYHAHFHLHLVLAQLSFVVFVNYVTSVIDMCSYV